jgi:hypothetical protein
MKYGIISVRDMSSVMFFMNHKLHKPKPDFVFIGAAH